MMAVQTSKSVTYINSSVGVESFKWSLAILYIYAKHHRQTIYSFRPPLNKAQLQMRDELILMSGLQWRHV